MNLLIVIRESVCIDHNDTNHNLDIIIAKF